jgi:hypothetical protein
MASLYNIRPVLIATMRLQVAELRELAKVALGGSRIETEMTDDFFCRNLVFIGHKFQNIDHFLCQRWLYRPFIDLQNRLCTTETIGLQKFSQRILQIQNKESRE